MVYLENMFHLCDSLKDQTHIIGKMNKLSQSIEVTIGVDLVIVLILELY